MCGAGCRVGRGAGLQLRVVVVVVVAAAAVLAPFPSIPGNG